MYYLYFLPHSWPPTVQDTHGALEGRSTNQEISCLKNPKNHYHDHLSTLGDDVFNEMWKSHETDQICFITEHRHLLRTKHAKLCKNMRELNKRYIYSVNVNEFICILVFWVIQFIMNFKQGNKLMIIFRAILGTW